MKVIALSGGIASGKSTVAQRLSELGAFHIDADQLAREAVAVGSVGLARIRERFGEQVIAADGTLNREALGQLVFQDTAALNDLNEIVHPEVRRLTTQRLTQIKAEAPEAIVIYDVPLLAESDTQMQWDLVVITEAPKDIRVRRMVELRGMTQEDAERRIANQASDAQRRAIADVIIDTSLSLADTRRQADDLWRTLQASHATEFAEPVELHLSDDRDQ